MNFENKFPIKNSIFVKLIIFFLIILIPIYFVGFNIYSWGIATVREEISNSTSSQVSYYLTSLENEIKRAQTLLNDCLNDRDINMLANAEGIMSNYERDQAILRVEEKLNSVSSSSDYIKNISANIPRIGLSISNSQYKNIDEETLGKVKFVYTKASNNIFFENENLFLFTSNMSIQKSEDSLPNIFLSIDLSIDKLSIALSKMNISEKSSSFIYLTKYNYSIVDDTDPKIAEKILINIKNKKNNSSNGSLSIYINNKKYYVTYCDSEYLNMVLVKYIPEEDLFHKVNSYKIWFWIFSIVTILIIIGFSLYTNGFINKPLSKLVKAFKKVETGDLNISIKHNKDDEFQYIYNHFNKMVNELNNLIEQVYKQKILVQTAELKQLQAQINPHFLYNSFFILRRRVENGDIKNAVIFCEHLGNYFQFITRNGEDQVPLIKEAEHARVYTDIQSVRFSKRIKIDFEQLPKEFENIMVPRLIFQPIIENAFEYGLENKKNEGILFISFLKHNTALVICVEDNGDYLKTDEIEILQKKLLKDEEVLETTGIINIHKRIRIMFGERSGVKVSRSELGGMKVEIVIELNNKYTKV